MRPSKPLLAAFAVALAPFVVPALAADGTDDASDDHAQLKADIARLEGKIDTLTKTVVSSVGRVTDNVSSLTTKVENSTARGEVAVFFGTRGSDGRGSGLLHAAGGNIAGASVSAIPGGSGIRLPAGTYEITVLHSAGTFLDVHDGRRFLPLANQYISTAGGSTRLSRGVVSAAAATTVYSFHYQWRSPLSLVSRAGARPTPAGGATDRPPNRGHFPVLGAITVRRL